jgi:tRNA-dihydrouridine synthase B
MAGVTDLPFRMLCRRFGAELAFVEMINCRSISHKSRKTRHMLSTEKGDSPLGVQILGCEEKYISKALDVLQPYSFDILDFNAACPAKKVVRRGEGAALLKEPKKLHKLLKLVVKKSRIPVTVKMRLGWDKDSINAGQVALYAQDAGAGALFIHGRTKAQEYSGSVNYAEIANVKKSVEIPVIASGDIFSAQLAERMLKETGCDGLAVARGSFGNPWIFREISRYLETGKIIPKPGRETVIKVMLEHLDSSIAFYGEKNGVVLFRKFFAWYTKGIRNIRPLREKSSRAKTTEEMTELISLLKV